MKRWSIVFKTLSNINRLKIIKLLLKGARLSVSDIAGELKISEKATSKHLIMLHNLDVLHNLGQENRVFYFLNTSMPRDFKKIIAHFK